MAKKKDTGNDNLVAVEEALSKTEHFIEENKNLLTGIVVGIAVIVIGLMAYNRYIKFPKNVEAHSQAFMAEKYFERDSLELALYGDNNYPGFEDILDDYKRTPTGNAAELYMGIISYRNGEYEEAIKYMKRYKGKDIFMTAMSFGVIGDCYMQLEDYDKALGYYLKAANHEENKLTTPVFLKKAGMTCELMGEYEDAIEHYQRIDDFYPETVEGRDIKKYVTRASILSAQ